MRAKNHRVGRYGLVLAATLALATPGQARGDFVLTGSQHLDVTTSHTTGLLYDSSTADVLAGGYIANARVNDEGLLRVLRPSGLAISSARVYNTGGIAVYSGAVSSLYAYATSSVGLSGGDVSYLYAHDTSSVGVSGGRVSELFAYDTSSVELSGGRVYDFLAAYHTSSVDISGGSVYASLDAYGTSSVDLSGGIVSCLSAHDTSRVTLHGYDFRVAGGLTLVGEEVLGTGLLTGKWFDGTSWAVSIGANDPTATILAIPEPATLFLLALGAVVAAKRRQSR